MAQEVRGTGFANLAYGSNRLTVSGDTQTCRHVAFSRRSLSPLCILIDQDSLSSRNEDRDVMPLGNVPGESPRLASPSHVVPGS